MVRNQRHKHFLLTYSHLKNENKSSIFGFSGNIKEKSWKVFPIFDFGHFFCPIFKTQNTFQHKIMRFFDLEHNRLIFVFSENDLLA